MHLHPVVMAKKSEEAVPVAEQRAPEPVAVAPAVVQAVPAKRSGLALAAWIVGGVLVAGALFGGGIAVGANLPGSGQGQFERPDFPGGGFPGGDRPAPPGDEPDDIQGTAPDTDSN